MDRSVDTTLFIKRRLDDILLVQLYVDDILFGSNNKELCEEFSCLMSKEFEMSMMGELTYFLGFNVKQGESGTFLNQTKYTRDLIRRFGFEGCKPMNTPMSPNTILDRDETVKPVDSKTFRGMIGSILEIHSSSLNNEV